MLTHPIIAAHVEAFDEAQPLGTGPLEPESQAHPAGIITRYDPKPLTSRAYDWEARQESYDGTEDSPTRHQIGFGASEADAVADLREQLDDAYAPLVSSDDLEFEDLRWQRGNDWMTEQDYLLDNYGVRRLFR